MKSYTEEITAVAAYANLTPEASALLQRYLLESATQQDKDALDEWMQESLANERLFDLLLLETRHCVNAETIKLLQYLTKKKLVKKKPLNKLLVGFSLVVLILFLTDYLLRLHPLRRIVRGEAEKDFVTETVQAGDAPAKTGLFKIKSEKIWISLPNGEFTLEVD
jgi:hypothetical protein